MDAAEIERRVVDVVARIAVDLDYPRERIDADTSLTQDLCLDSLRFVELTIALEDALSLDEFPMQAWADTQLELEGARFSIRSLVGQCSKSLGSGTRTDYSDPT